MRSAAPACLFTALLLALPAAPRAEFRHFSSRLIDAGGREFFFASAVDRDANVFIVANLLGPGNVGGAEVGPGLMIAKFDAAGDPLWARNLASSYSPQLPPTTFSIDAASDGGVLIAGWFGATVDFGAGPITALGTDAFLLKLDAGGVLQWQRRYGGNLMQRATSVVVGPDGSFVIGGENQLEVDFGGGIIRSNGTSDAFIAKFTADGDHIWSRGYGFAGIQSVSWLDIGDDNGIALALRFDNGAIDVGGGLLSNLGESDILMLVLGPDGSYRWSKHAATVQVDFLAAVALGSRNDLTVCGWLERPLDLGGGVLPPPTTASTVGFVASYDSTGVHRWSYLIPDPVRSAVYGLDVDRSGNCIAVGRNEGTFVFGRHALPPTPGGLLMGFGPDGQPLGVKSLGNATLRVHVDRERDRIGVFGTVREPTDFGGGLLHPHEEDLVLASLGLRRPADVAITQLAARATTPGVELRWEIASGEPIVSYSVSRRVESASTADLLHSASAADGAYSFLDRDIRPGHVHTYRITVTTALGDEVVSNPVSVAVAPAINALEQNAPNPFNPVTTFAYSLAEAARVSIVIYDTGGALVARLDQGMQAAGRHEASWGGHNAHGEFVGSGVYFYRLEGVPGVAARKLVLLK